MNASNMADLQERRMRLLTSGRKMDTAEETSEPMLRLASIVPESVVDGPGIRFVLFAQGCPHRCRGCHNPETHLLTGGRKVPVPAVFEQYLQNRSCRGITLSGGEPFLQASLLAELANQIHSVRGDVITYTGYVHEQLIREVNPAVRRLLSETDLLIDGPFLLEKRCPEQPFVGSSNQRMIALSKAGNRLLELIQKIKPLPQIKYFGA